MDVPWAAPARGARAPLTDETREMWTKLVLARYDVCNHCGPFDRCMQFFCVSCRVGGLCGKTFSEGAPHHTHDRLQVFNIHGQLSIDSSELPLTLSYNIDEIALFLSRGRHMFYVRTRLPATTEPQIWCEGCYEYVSDHAEQNDDIVKVCSIECFLEYDCRWRVHSGELTMPAEGDNNFAMTENVMLVGEMDSHNAQSLGKRFREDDDSHPRTTGVMPNGGVQGPAYNAPGGVPLGQPLPGMGARPRAQATDPHSIAERLPRERIAERMKALQELVPNSNKTDTASMLDEIIDYVKYLQLQVKVLSMSGSAGALPSLVNDMPAEGGNNFCASAGSSGVTNPGQDGLERQVTRMMEVDDDMGSAMQYLQSKGLCLMPISLATAISTTNKEPNEGSPENNSGKAPATATAGAGPSSKGDASGSEGET